MLKVKIVCVGKLKESWLREGAEEYAKRLKRFCSLQIVEIDEEKLSQGASAAQTAQMLKKEGEALLKHLSGVGICLDVKGTQTDSEELSQLIQEIPQTSPSVTFFVGGSHGLDDAVKNACRFRLAFGRATFPHQLFRVMLLEQIYRAFMIAGGGEYHK